jgi:hypothetical protein
MISGMADRETIDSAGGFSHAFIAVPGSLADALDGT